MIEREEKKNKKVEVFVDRQFFQLFKPDSLLWTIIEILKINKNTQTKKVEKFHDYKIF